MQYLNLGTEEKKPALSFESFFSINEKLSRQLYEQKFKFESINTNIYDIFIRGNFKSKRRRSKIKLMTDQLMK